jgi:hypothetical protein
MRKFVTSDHMIHSKIQLEFFRLVLFKHMNLSYYIHIMRMADPKEPRVMYKYLYYLSENDRQVNPEWSQFILMMQLRISENP